jgi:hypothetical protein
MQMDSMDVPDAGSVLDHIVYMKYSLANYFHAQIDPPEIEILGLDICGVDECYTLYSMANGVTPTSNEEVLFVRYYIKTSNMEIAYSLQDNFFNRGSIYDTAAFQGKIVVDMKVDHCYEELDEKFDVLAPGFAFDGSVDTPRIDESSAVGITVLSVFSILFMMF